MAAKMNIAMFRCSPYIAKPTAYNMHPQAMLTSGLFFFVKEMINGVSITHTIPLIDHEEWHGKLSVESKAPITNKEEMAIAYTPGVAAPCLEIEKDESLAYTYTGKWNTVAVITDGTAVLGLGDIGPSAGMPVMEGKCALFKVFAGIDAIPICINTKDPDEIVDTVYHISKSFGGINLEDISAPRCFDIEKRLIEKCDIPVFHGAMTTMLGHTSVSIRLQVKQYGV